MAVASSLCIFFAGCSINSQRLYTNALMVLVVMLVTVVASNLSCEELEPVSYKSLQRYVVKYR